MLSAIILDLFLNMKEHGKVHVILWLTKLFKRKPKDDVSITSIQIMRPNTDIQPFQVWGVRPTLM